MYSVRVRYTGLSIALQNVDETMILINRPGLTKVQLRENRPVLTESSVWKSTNRDVPDDIIVGGTTVQKVPSLGELSLEPSYSDTLS